MDYKNGVRAKVSNDAGFKKMNPHPIFATRSKSRYYSKLRRNLGALKN